jgi:serine protease Do
MKNPIVTCLLPLLLLATAVQAAEPEVKKEVIIRRHAAPGDGSQEFDVRLDGPAEMEKVAYLGVETAPVDPTVAAQLGLARGTGVVVRRVAEGSPAAAVLQPHDVMTKLDDQILVNMAQLTVLVRNHKVGDEVKLTYVRGGKESTAKVKLGEREVPKFSWAPSASAPAMQFFGHAAPMAGGAMGFSRAMPAVPGVPALPPGEAGDVMRVIGGDRMHWFGQPRVHVMRRHGGAGSTILDLAAGNFVFSDDQGSVEVSAAEGKRELTVKDKDGKVTFQGPINTPDEREKLPPEVKQRLDDIGGAEFGPERGEIKVETKVFEPATKVHLRLQEPGAQAASPEPGMRTL